MKRTLTDPSVLKPSDVDALRVLDDDGNPWHPPAPDKLTQTRWSALAEAKLHAATVALQRHAVLSMAIALGAGYLVGRVLAARSS